MGSKRIQRITTEALYYVDDNGNETSIDFTTCLETYLRWSTNNTTTPKQLEGYRKSKWVGEMHLLGDFDMSMDENTFNPPYVEFNDKLGSRFEFKSQEACMEFEENLRAMGWNLFDSDD